MNKLTVEELKWKVKEALGVHPNQLDSDTMREAGVGFYVALIPDNYKDRLQYYGNLLVQQCFSCKTEDPRLKSELLSIASALSYLINSTSYHDGKYHDYDEREINRKLRR